MESQILELIEEEVTRRVNLRLNGALEVVAKTYDIPLERLMKDAANVEVAFCKGVLKSKKRCLKTTRRSRSNRTFRCCKFSGISSNQGRNRYRSKSKKNFCSKN